MCMRGQMLQMTPTVSQDTTWQPEDHTALAVAIERLERELPGWWWSVGACHVSADASIGPDHKGPAAHLLRDKIFDDGFHNDIPQPSSCAEALNSCIDDAMHALKNQK